MKFFLSAIDSLSEWSAKITGLVVVVVIGLVIAEVVLRYGFNSPTVWNAELVIYLCGYLYLMGGAYVLRLHEHVRVDVIYGRFRLRVRAILNMVAAIFFFAFLAVLIWKGGEWTWAALVGGKTSGSPWDPIIFPRRLAIPLAASLLLLQGVAKFIRDFRTARTGEELHEY